MRKRPVRVYLASPLFSIAERDFNLKVKGVIESVKGYEVFLPQTIPYEGPEIVYRDCIKHLRKSDVVVAVLDGAQADDGTSYEVGVARVMGKKVIGLRTDTRQTGDTGGFNAMLFVGPQVLITQDWERELTSYLEALQARKVKGKGWKR